MVSGVDHIVIQGGLNRYHCDADENDIRASRIIFQDKKSEDERLPVPGTSTRGDERGGGLIGE